ncbi:hypothetical protein TKK_0000112 [Trichogramma kaykai]
MDVVLRTDFLAIKHNIWPAPIKNGTNLVICGHIFSVPEENSLNNCKVICALCIRTKNRNENDYKVQISIDDQWQVTQHTCKCLASITFDCKHIYALIYFINNERQRLHLHTHQAVYVSTRYTIRFRVRKRSATDVCTCAAK